MNTRRLDDSCRILSHVDKAEGPDVRTTTRWDQDFTYIWRRATRLPTIPKGQRCVAIGTERARQRFANLKL